MSRGESFLILGGAGLVGKQVARRIAAYLNPRKIVIVSLFEQDVQEALEELRQEFRKGVEWAGEWGNVFVRQQYVSKSRSQLLSDPGTRETLYADLFGSLDDTYENSQLVSLIREHKPDVIVDSINTATAISYQDVDKASAVAKRQVESLLDALGSGDLGAAQDHQSSVEMAFETLVLSQALPQLVRHAQILDRAMREVGTRLYLKIGTTGTGGMGLNIPYTHSEDKPSSQLMTKTAVGFAHTGLMFLMARTPGGAIVKEIKPGAMIGYADISHRVIRSKSTGIVTYTYSSCVQPLGDRLTLRESTNGYQQVGELTIPVADTGENGLFAKGEFEAITSLRQMEFVTPEEIALEVMLEIKGGNTGRDVIGAIDGAVINPSYRAGYLRQQALADMYRLEAEHQVYSVALGQLGPPELSKLLWEAQLLKIEYGTFSEMLTHKPEKIAERLYQHVGSNAKLSQAITSIGVPILAPDGDHVIRGPFIKIPEIKDDTEIAIRPGDVDKWAAKGWVDLRASNFVNWQKRFKRMEETRQRTRGRGSATVSREVYVFDEIRIGEVVGWIFNNEEGGYRIK